MSGVLSQLSRKSSHSSSVAVHTANRLQIESRNQQWLCPGPGGVDEVWHMQADNTVANDPEARDTAQLELSPELWPTPKQHWSESSWVGHNDP